jgi:hypothetical protein
MGRGKFSFPIPGRRSKKADQDDDTRSALSMPVTHEWRSHLEDPSSKAHRVLGTSEPLYRSTSKQSVPPSPSPSYMSITVSEASFGSDVDDRASRSGTEHHRPGVSRRPSSTVMGRAYSGDGRQTSDRSTASQRLHPQSSNSTLRSHYDSKSSPLSISQQTSDSAVRDRALRRGKPEVVAEYNRNGYLASPVSPVILDEARRRDNRKSRPARLDLSKLFPKPRGGDGNNYSNALLSPTKMVSSPAAMSVTSEYHYPHPMTREPTPNPRGQVTLKPTSRQHAPTTITPISPVRGFKRDQYDNAKVHVRRPPKGVEHWFDALDEDSDEALERLKVPILAPRAMRPSVVPKVPVSQTLSYRQPPHATIARPASRTQYLTPTVPRNDTFTHDDLVDVARLASSSQFSLVSTKTKDSAMSKVNLQDSSVLSFSSSEDEEPKVRPAKIPVRKSLDTEDTGEIIIGQAQAFEMRHQRRPSTAQMSARSISTSAATIDIMYTPEPPFSPFHYPRNSTYSGSRRSSHVRQPSAIPEDGDFRPKTAANTSLFSSAHSITSARTSTSEPKPRIDGEQKLMVVTAEEEALLELMRKKRASMAKKEAAPAGNSVDFKNKGHTTPLMDSHRPYRTSGFLAEASPVRAAESKSVPRARGITPSPLLLPPRGRPRNSQHEAMGETHFRDRSTSDAWSEQRDRPSTRTSIPPHLAMPSEFSPIDLFPPGSPMLATSIASPTTTDHLSPLPSPITPGLRAFEADVNVKVANSDTSNDSDDLVILDTGIIGAPSESIKSASSHDLTAHHRRRTASSGADFPLPPTSGLTDLPPVSERSSSPPSIIEPPAPKLSNKNPRRINDLAQSETKPSRSRQSSVHSSHSQLSVHSHSSDLAKSRNVSRQSSATSMNGTAKANRSSVSDDVLAAWNSLGGTY